MGTVDIKVPEYGALIYEPCSRGTGRGRGGSKKRRDYPEGPFLNIVNKNEPVNTRMRPRLVRSLA